MFTGIIRELGRVEAIEGGEKGVRLHVRAPETSATTHVGDSVSINGVCLTAVGVSDGVISFDAVPETLTRSSLGRLRPSDEINVEPAVRAGEPLGGHIVQGHVDGIGAVRSLEPEGDGMRLEVAALPEILRYCVEKGPIAVDGVSLTIAGLSSDSFSIAVVPHTLQATTLGWLEPDDPVNLEVDVLAKYVERLLVR